MVRSFVCPPVRLCLRSIVLTIIRSLVRSFVRPFDRTFVCRYVFLFGSLVYFLVRPSLYSPSVLLLRLFFFSLSFFPWCDRSSVHLIVPLCVFSSDRSFVGPVFRWSGRSSVLPFDCAFVRSFVRSFVRWSDHLFARSIISLSVGIFFCLARWFIFLFVPPFYSPVLLIRSFSFLLLIVLSLCDRSSVRLIVPLFVFSSDRSFVGSIVRLSSRSIVPSFNRSYEHSFVGTIICPPVRSHLRLSVCFFVWLVGLFSCSSFPIFTFCSFTSTFFFLIVLSLV